MMLCPLHANLPILEEEGKGRMPELGDVGFSDVSIDDEGCATCSFTSSYGGSADRHILTPSNLLKRVSDATDTHPIPLLE